MTFRFTTILLCSFALSSSSFAQGSLSSRYEISQRAFDSVTHQAFAKMSSGTEDITNFGNYVSFKTEEDTKFELSGNYFFDIRTKPQDVSVTRDKEYFAVGFTGAGSIIGNNVATLFGEGKLTTGTNLGVKLSWQMNRPAIDATLTTSRLTAEKVDALEFERDQKVDSIRNYLAMVGLKLQQANLVLSESQRKLGILKTALPEINADLAACKTDSCRLMFTDSLVKVNSSIASEEANIKMITKKRDLLQDIDVLRQIKANTPSDQLSNRAKYLVSVYGLPAHMTFLDTLTNLVRQQYEDTITKVMIARPVQGINISWLSVIGNWNRVAFRTYDAALPFDMGLKKNSFDGFNIGLQANFYHFNKVFQRASLLNIALLWKCTNNLTDLSTSKLTDEKTVKNGDVTRKSATEYNVYTDPVTNYNTWQLPINYYRFFGKNLNLGFHLMASADWREDKVSIYDAGAGFIFGLNNTTTKRILNFELFLTYKDIGRKLADDDVTTWKQMQLGFSVAVPFMIYKN
jgi:hypothetical protein